MEKNKKILVYVSIISIILITFFSGYYLCYFLPNYNQEKLGLDQQKVDELSHALKRIDALEKNNQNIITTSTAPILTTQENVDIKPTSRTVEPISQKVDPLIKIEKCKNQAKYSADQQAKRDYLQAFEDAQKKGDTETAQFYLEASFGPDHPADYDTNYHVAYMNCLDN